MTDRSSLFSFIRRQVPGPLVTAINDWPGRPTRAEVLRPVTMRERLGASIAKTLILRYQRELRAETMRAEEGWRSYVETKRERAKERL